MADDSSNKVPDIGLQTAEHEELLNIIDTLRSQGVSYHVELPQIIVVGDQSSGKSSVLEAISGLRFPTKDILCTRFATELILRRAPATKVTVTVTAAPDQTKERKKALSTFTPPSSTTSEFAAIVQSAEKAMGLGEGNTGFSKDVLKVELCGPTQPNLTLVDLPGIFSGRNRAQSTADGELVRAMVEEYMKNKRSIILAVVSAHNEVVNQSITKLARQNDIDPQGQRTLGIITKPDLVHAGSPKEAALVALARNEDVYFELGWHVLKNRDYDTQDTTSSERDTAEKDFFETRLWSSKVYTSQLGIESLRPRLSKVLLDKILIELPSLLLDVERKLTVCKTELRSLGAPRGSVLEQRTYLSNSSQQFVELMRNAIRGIYEDDFFGGSETNEGYNKRLRAVVQHSLTSLAGEMRVDGHAQEIVDGELTEKQKESPAYITRQDYINTVEIRMRRNRGRELPGLFNPSIIDELFIAQAKPWEDILYETEKSLVEAARTTLSLAIHHVFDSATADGVMRKIICPSMETVVKKLHAKVREVLKPHMSGHAITYNHYFIENLQKRRRKAQEEVLAKKIRTFYGEGPDPSSEEREKRWVSEGTDTGALVKALSEGTEADMSRFACMDATNAMEAYYKVALKTVVDNFGIFAVEECLLNKLPELFKPALVFELDDENVLEIAGESAATIAKREDLSNQEKVLEETMVTLRRVKTIQGPVR